MESTTRALEAFDAVSSHEAIRRDADEFVDLQPGDAYPQGDVIVARFDVAPKCKGPYRGRQLVPGDTQGSRHVAEGVVELYAPDEDDALAILNRLFPRTLDHSVFFFGPVVVSQEGWTMTHDEHGNRQFPAGVDQILYQRSLSAVDKKIRRALD